MEWLDWFSKTENTKPLALLIFFVTFAGIVLYVYGSNKRSKRLESYKDIPFLDDDKAEPANDEAGDRATRTKP